MITIISEPTYQNSKWQASVTNKNNYVQYRKYFFTAALEMESSLSEDRLLYDVLHQVFLPLDGICFKDNGLDYLPYD